LIFVILDEYQDVNLSQVELIIKTIEPNVSRMFALGDEKQNIYQFRSSDANIFSILQKKLSAKVLPLPISYRCSIAVVAEAQKIVPQLQSGPNAKSGKVSLYFIR